MHSGLCIYCELNTVAISMAYMSRACCYFITVSLAPEAMAASSSSVMSMARFITVGSLVFRIGALARGDRILHDFA